jgi:hypothetical protein
VYIRTCVLIRFRDWVQAALIQAESFSTHSQAQGEFHSLSNDDVSRVATTTSNGGAAKPSLNTSSSSMNGHSENNVPSAKGFISASAMATAITGLGGDESELFAGLQDDSDRADDLDDLNFSDSD